MSSSSTLLEQRHGVMRGHPPVLQVRICRMARGSITRVKINNDRMIVEPKKNTFTNNEDILVDRIFYFELNPIIRLTPLLRDQAIIIVDM
jgi:hypothetical protein